MNKIILFLVATAIGLSARADYTVQTYQPTYPAQAFGYSSPYQQYQPLSVAQPAQVAQPYAQNYNQGYYQNSYQNPYQTQYQGAYANPYQYQNPYGYGNNSVYPSAVSALSSLGSTGGTKQIVKNIGQSMIYSMMRGY